MNKQEWNDHLDMVDPCTCDQEQFYKLAEIAPTPEALAYLEGIEEARQRAFSNSLSPLQSMM